MDLAASLVLLAALVAIASARALLARRQQYARVERDAVFFPAAVQTPLYWVLQRPARWLVDLRVSPNAITIASLVPCVGAAFALARGHLGIGASLLCLGFAGDALDGLVARAGKRASAGGALIDSTADRVSEALAFGGIACFFRQSEALLALTLAAGAAAQLVSYVSAKVDAHPEAVVPRGMMRRSERAALLVSGAALSSLAETITKSSFGDAPLVIALGVIAVVAFPSATHRLFVLVRSVDRRDRESPHLDPPRPER
jgi:phosphatidylglycerophosphate synthase